MSSTVVKKVLVTGSRGYVGNYLLKNIAWKYPKIQCIGMSRSGRVRKGETRTGTMHNVTYVQGDCLSPNSFKDELEDVDAVIHAVGCLFEINGLSHDGSNRDSCINMAHEFQKHA